MVTLYRALWRRVPEPVPWGWVHLMVAATNIMRRLGYTDRQLRALATGRAPAQQR
jgi:hypothetical protein